jgi:DNA repair exonuclease SbcCD nuclease subunit
MLQVSRSSEGRKRRIHGRDEYHVQSAVSICGQVQERADVTPEFERVTCLHCQRAPEYKEWLRLRQQALLSTEEPIIETDAQKRAKIARLYETARVLRERADEYENDALRLEESLNHVRAALKALSS